jgi:putative adenylate-forming enzyme
MNKIEKKFRILKQFFITKKYKQSSKLKELQVSKLIELLLEVKNNKFYGKTATSLLRKINSEDFNIQDILNGFPVINKKEFMKNFEAINKVGLTLKQTLSIASNAEETRNFGEQHNNNITIGLSSGTSGNKGVFLVSEEESARWVGYILKRMLPKPYLSIHKIAFFLRANSNLYESVSSNLIKFSFYDLMNPVETYIQELNEQQPTILIAPAQVLKLLSNNKYLDINPKKIISVAEVLEEKDKKLIEERFSQKVHQIYQCTEGFLAHTCEYGNLHLNEDIVIIEKEWLDKTSNRFSPIITDLSRKTQPVIRYKLDDILIENTKQCECGSCFTRIEKIEGRCDDILKLQNKDNIEYLLYPDYVSRAIISIEAPLEEYKVIKRGDTLNITIFPLNKEIENQIEKAMEKLYMKHSLKPLKHIYSPWEKEKVSIKRRRIIEDAV